MNRPHRTLSEGSPSAQRLAAGGRKVVDFRPMRNRKKLDGSVPSWDGRTISLRGVSFRADAKGGAPLSLQLASAIQDAIVRRKLRPGAVLPTIHEWAAACGTGVKAPRHALERLAAGGWARPVRGVGFVVEHRGEDAGANDRVLLYVRQTGFSYYCAGLTSVLDARLTAKGYKPFAVNAWGRSEAPACGRFEALLKERWALVVLIDGGAEACRLAAASGHPFLLLDSAKAPLAARQAATCVGSIGTRFGGALSEFVRACIRQGVRRVVQFRYDPGSYDAARPLAEAGIAAETVRVGRESSPAAVAQASLSLMRRLVAERRLPDLFLFTDDYLAQGALAALDAAGVRVPEDVKVATHANRGLGPIWHKPLTRLEVDPVAHGRAVADAILRYLRTGERPLGLELGAAWKKGETF